jgi:hypothetical protein
MFLIVGPGKAPNDIIVKLNPEERRKGDEEGNWRQDRAEREGLQPDWKDGTERGNHIIGGGGEVAYEKWKGELRQWRPDPNGFGKADSRDNVQVRTTRRADPYHKVKPKDRDEFFVVFLEVEADMVTHHIVGCIRARDAKKFPLEDIGNKGRPCHPVPYDKMLNVAHLIEHLFGKW